MSDELFRFTILRPADPLSPGRVIRLFADEDAEELGEKTVDVLVEQLSAVARAGREPGGDPAGVANGFNLDVNLRSARAAVHQRLLAGRGGQGQGHVDLADAARGIEIVRHVMDQRETPDYRAMANARLVTPPKATDSEGSALTEGRFILPDPRDGLFYPLAAPQPRPSGFALLKIVKQQVLRYEAGEVAHIENVLAGESRERIHRTLDRTEDVSVFDTETTREESRDLQTAERFELATESQKQLEKQSQWEVGTDVTAKYPPYVEVGLNASAGGSSVRNTAERRATQFSREITQEAASAVSTRIREQRKRTVLSEIEETNRHAIENAGSPDHVVGIYQWVEKVMQAQVFSYGERLMYDLTLPEPGAFLAYALTHAAATESGVSAQHPGPWELNPEDLEKGQLVERSREVQCDRRHPAANAGDQVGREEN